MKQTKYHRANGTKIATWLRDGGRCVRCGHTCDPIIGNGEVHHIVALSVNGSDSVENTALLCTYCHSLCHSIFGSKANPTQSEWRKFLNLQWPLSNEQMIAKRWPNHQPDIILSSIELPARHELQAMLNAVDNANKRRAANEYAEMADRFNRRIKKWWSDNKGILEGLCGAAE